MAERLDRKTWLVNVWYMLTTCNQDFADMDQFHVEANERKPVGRNTLPKNAIPLSRNSSRRRLSDFINAAVTGIRR
jgi:hypothetical protein